MTVIRIQSGRCGRHRGQRTITASTTTATTTTSTPGYEWWCLLLLLRYTFVHKKIVIIIIIIIVIIRSMYTCIRVDLCTSGVLYEYMLISYNKLALEASNPTRNTQYPITPSNAFDTVYCLRGGSAYTYESWTLTYGWRHVTFGRDEYSE